MRRINFRQRVEERERNLSLKEKQDLKLITFKLSEMVRSARIEKGYTQEKLALKMGKKQSSIARLEAGTHIPSIKFLNEIAIALGTFLIGPSFDSLNQFYAKETLLPRVEREMASTMYVYSEPKIPNYMIRDYQGIESLVQLNLNNQYYGKER